MPDQFPGDSMLDMYIFETSQNLEQLEAVILSCEESACFTPEAINEIFRIMHTIKGSSAMMLYGNVSNLAHRIEDLFYFLREQKPPNLDCSALSDLVLSSVDFIKVELQKIKAGDEVDGDCSDLMQSIEEFLALLKQQNPLGAETDKTVTENRQQYYIAPVRPADASPGNMFRATLYFEDGCEMENIRAYTVVHHLKELTQDIHFIPEDILENDGSVEVIRKQGFMICTRVDRSYEEMQQFFMQSLFLKSLELVQMEDDQAVYEFSKPSGRPVEVSPIKVPKVQPESVETSNSAVSAAQSLMSVSVAKLDKLMDLVGEMVIAEAMVTQNPDLRGLELERFSKAARQLRKITGELQDTVMSIRMVPLTATFQKMHRVARDMTKKLDKEVHLEMIGEATEVDKNIIEHISDPLMHLIRNSIDHGIEAAEERVARGKPGIGTVTLEARNAGSDVFVVVRDDGRGLNKQKILQRARENGLLHKAESEMTDRDIYNLIFLPGFSTKDSISEFSGRGVGMDVVTRNLETIGGMVSVDSLEGEGTTITLKIPLTLAIIDGMNVKVGNSIYTIPIPSIQESFKPATDDIITDPDGNELAMVRGKCYQILRLHRCFGVKAAKTELADGILIMVEQDGRTICLLVDELLGQQQVVVKALPSYLRDMKRKRGLAGCTLLGDGTISLILDIAGITDASQAG